MPIQSSNGLPNAVRPRKIQMPIRPSSIRYLFFVRILNPVKDKFSASFFSLCNFLYFVCAAIVFCENGCFAALDFLRFAFLVESEADFDGVFGVLGARGVRIG